MQSGWRVGSIFGIPLYIDPSWLIVLGLVALQMGLPLQGSLGIAAYGIGIVMALLLFGSVLLHELGHSLVARAQGIKVNAITLFLFGGIASIDQESKTPGKAFQVAIAGPVVSITLFLLLLGLSTLVPVAPIPLRELVWTLARINLVLALFNLIPGLPLDGGQVLKAAVWKATGSRFKGVHWAATSGKVLGWLAVILGLGSLFLLQSGLGLWIAFLGWFGVQNASSYDRVTDLQETLLQLKASDAMTREFRVVDADMTLRQFADDYLLNQIGPSVYFAASDGRYRGMVIVDDLNYVERSQWETQNLYRIIKPLSEIPTLEESSRLVDVIQIMESKQLSQITILSPAGAVAGVIDRGDVVRAIAQKMNIPIPEAAIKQIKQDGHYPPGFQLGALAQSAAEGAEEAGNK
ncbi:site-2 protease family protein [Leptothermofonsia sp. ETS-13]|uniref:site-2 protease family protein n=1 Tax=Leptothermofonsia sp. ETS-13 TaxID=3035696 RepID=UPI003B9F95FB